MKEAGHGTIESGKSFSAREMEEAGRAYERLARRINELMKKDKLTTAEAREWDLILNNTMVIGEILDGKMPEELAGLEK